MSGIIDTTTKTQSRLTNAAAIRVIQRFVKEVQQGRNLLEASDALLNSPSTWTSTMTKKLLLSQKVRAGVVKVLNNGNDPQKRCYPVATHKVWDLVTGSKASYRYDSRNAGIHGTYDIQTVWIAVCNEYGIIFPTLQEKDPSGGGTDSHSDGDNIIIDGIPHINDNTYYCTRRPYKTCSDQANTSQLMNRLRQLVSIHQKRKYKRDSDEGFIDQDRLVDVVRGTNLDTVREFPHRGQKVDAAVQMFVDCSSSMGTHDDDQEIACYLALALGKSFQRLKVPLSVVAFDNSPLMVKDWNDRIQDTKVDKLSGGGGTDLPLSMEQCLGHLMKRREKRKVQIVLTDGDIGTRNEWWKTVERLRLTKGYECYAFGIGRDIPPGFFDGAVGSLESKTMIPTIAREVGNILIYKP